MKVLLWGQMMCKFYLPEKIYNHIYLLIDLREAQSAFL